MSDIAVKVENLSKLYHIGAKQEQYATLRSALVSGVKRLTTRRSVQKIEENNLWALKDISFEIKQGEVVGIMGRNGAGKSTLLKVLAHITEPTKGRVSIYGRVGSLLEVGTGFHPELTGRDNIYLNGAILGMKRVEIQRKFDEIVAFAEIEKFLDTPVKRYSSGMYVRLAFAVAAHLEPEILVVDEVLAVGDAEFQKKCLGKMSDVAKEGRTVLFVSHNMAAVNRLCHNGLLLDAGQIKFSGEISWVTSKYMMSGVGTSAERQWADPKTAPGDQVARLKSVRITQKGKLTDTIDIRYPVMVEMEYWNLKQEAMLLAGFSFINDQGTIVFVSPDIHDPEWGNKPKPKGLFRAQCIIPGNLFSEGLINVVAEVSTAKPVYEIHFLEFDSVSFQVVDQDEPGSVRAGWGRNIPGVVRPWLDWKTEFIEDL